MFASVECVSMSDLVLTFGVLKASSASSPVFNVMNENNVPEITRNPLILNK